MRRGRAIRRLFRDPSPQTLLVGSFAAMIVAGTGLLMLPWCRQPGVVGLLDALFTATSAVCVTGLVVVETGNDFTIWGQVVILALIQAGGLGIMTFALMAYQAAGRMPSMRSGEALEKLLFQASVPARVRYHLRNVLRFTLAFELTGFLLLLMLVDGPGGPGARAFSALFHAVSAFCNAGFSLRPDSLVPYAGNLPVLVVYASLIIAGGLGFLVLEEVAVHVRMLRGEPSTPRPPRLSLHARAVLTTTALLLLGGAAVLATAGGQSLLDAAFLSVTARTAGFNNVAVGGLPGAALMTLAVLMFIGGSPGSCSGGVRTTTVAVWWATLRSRLLGLRHTELLGRRLPPAVLEAALMVVSLALLWNTVGFALLSVTEAGTAGEAMGLVFEQLSAFGTVGLSTGVTAKLSTPGRLWLIATMFVGRVGPLTLATWIIRERRVELTPPLGRVVIG